MVKIIISLLTHLGWKLQQFDVKKVVLQGHLEEEVYMEITTGFGYIEEKNKVRRLKTALYGLKQSLPLCLGDLLGQSFP